MLNGRMMEKKRNIILEKSFDFSLNIIQLYKVLIEEKEYVISKQLLRAATSIGANVTEAQAGQSKKDFIAKMCVASKESRETEYWLLLLLKSNYSVRASECIPTLLTEVNDIINILARIIKTAMQK